MDLLNSTIESQKGPNGALQMEYFHTASSSHLSLYRSLLVCNECTVESRYLELGYLEFCEIRNVYLNKKYILIAFSNQNLAYDTFLQVQITRGENQFALRVI